MKTDSTLQPRHFPAGEGKSYKLGRIFDAMIAEVTMLDTGTPTRPGSGEAHAIATKYGLEFLPS